ncbi:tRNA lysidine(34) synthetase TilS [Haliangium ochraceum]|uniref:tRNA(Ile)-lysidine synthase n=1 Tax=Haliangium ochraceum (strain DSM 14365 / JCM 11303 / SMP-2) TaxID=502025 RepID=D0LWB7_HALO1|nr:tRNA lysidine(34) synthetase TilS [Haliangium ochraceum]ACY16049.1 tRNA(Ile)-lysidine synthetase [Haliangium ochraceum DSM 14365]
MDALLEHVAEALGAHALGPEDAIGVACSGGPDSSALAHACLRLASAERARIGPVTLLHVDHGLRPDSGADAAAVYALAEPFGAAVHVVRAEVDRDRASLEAAARDARFAALDALAEQLGLRFVLLAHTASDQAETVLMRVLRGTGVFGLAAMQPRRGRYLRPLLGLERGDIEAYCARAGVVALADPMNRDPAFLRVRVRRRWLPALREENPRIDRALCRLAESAAQQREVLSYAAERLLAEARASDADEPAYRVAALRQAPAAVRARALAEMCTRVGAPPPEAVHLAAIDALLAASAAGSRRLSLPGAEAERAYDRLYVRASAPAAAVADAAAADAELAAVRVRGPDGPYQVRRWQPGDRMRPARLRGRSRTLGRLFIDAKVPRAERARAVVVTRQGDGAIVWAQHLGPAFDIEISVSLTAGEPLAR